jgi:hypothetical protein
MALLQSDLTKALAVGLVSLVALVSAVLAAASTSAATLKPAEATIPHSSLSPPPSVTSAPKPLAKRTHSAKLSVKLPEPTSQEISPRTNSSTPLQTTTSCVQGPLCSPLANVRSAPIAVAATAAPAPEAQAVAETAVAVEPDAVEAPRAALWPAAARASRVTVDKEPTQSNTVPSREPERVRQLQPFPRVDMFRQHEEQEVKAEAQRATSDADWAAIRARIAQREQEARNRARAVVPPTSAGSWTGRAGVTDLREPDK